MPLLASPPPPFTTPAELWQAALAELRLQMTRATFHAWLSGSEVVAPASRLACLVIAVRSRPAEEWLTYRLQPIIERTLAGLAGYRVEVFFWATPMRKRSLARLSPEQLPGVPAPFEEAREHKPGREALLSTVQPGLPTGSLPPSHSNRPVFNPDSASPTRPAGDTAMPDSPHPTRVRIYSHLMASHFLHVEDALGLGTGKIRLFAGQYHRSQGMSAHSQFYMDLADARVVFEALARGEQGFSHRAYKGTPPQARPEPGRRNGRTAISRVLSINVKGENVYIELKTGPGKLTNTGAITPHGKPEVEVNVGFKLYEARRLAASVLAYIQAWDVMRMMVNQQMVSKPSPYLLVPAVSVANGIQSAPANGAPKPNGGTRPPIVAANGRPVTRKDPVPKATSANATTAVKQANSQPEKPGTAVTSVTSSTGLDTQPLKYGNGSVVDANNLTEVQTFQRYVTEKKAAPESKAVLLDYYRQRVQVPATVASQ